MVLRKLSFCTRTVKGRQEAIFNALVERIEVVSLVHFVFELKSGARVEDKVEEVRDIALVGFSCKRIFFQQFIDNTFLKVYSEYIRYIQKGDRHEYNYLKRISGSYI